MTQTIARAVPCVLVPIAVAVLVAALALVGAWRSTALAQSAAQTWDVQVGLDDMQTGASAQAFGPNPLVIRAGDTVAWKFAGFHSVTFNAGGPRLAEFAPGPGQGELQLGPAFFPTGPASGSSYDGSVQASSGLPLEGPPDQFGYSLRFTKPGLYGYVCTIHPGMRGEIEVLEAGATLPETPAQAKTRGQVTLQTLVGNVNANIGHMTGPDHIRPAAANAGTHTVFAGFADPFGASFLGFGPAEITVRRGDNVAFVFPDPFEIHTVSFLSGGQQPEFIVPKPQAAGPPALTLNPIVLAPQGGPSYTGSGYLNSGVVETPGLFVARFDAPAGTYEYLCLVHPFMRGKVTVTG